MNFASNSVFGETLKSVDLRLLPAHTADKLKYIFALATRPGGLTDKSDGLTSRHRIAEVAADRVSKAKAYNDNIKNSEFETMNVFEREKNSGTQLNQNIQMNRPDQNIRMTRPDQNISQNNPPIRINSPIRPTFNIPLTQPTDNSPLTRPT